MITKSIKTTFGTIEVTIPSDRSEITIGLLQALTPEPGHSFGPLEQLSILSGIPSGLEEGANPDVVSLCDVTDPEALSVFDETLQKLAYQIAAFVEVQTIPDHVVLDVPHAQRSHGKFLGLFNRKHVGKLIPVIKNLGIHPAGAYMEAKEVIKGEYERWERVKKIEGYENVDFNPSIESQIRILSLYFYVPATGDKFSPNRAAQFDEVIRKMKITEALPIARYFFLSYPNLSRPKVTPSLESLMKLRSKQV